MSKQAQSQSIPPSGDSAATHGNLVEERLVCWYFVAALVYLFISLTGGLLMSLQLVQWNPHQGIEYLSPGRWRMIHTNAIAYGLEFTAEGLPLNGDFEATPFDTSWANGIGLGTQVNGLNGTSQAMFLDSSDGSEVTQASTPFGSTVRLEMFFASATPTAGNASGFNLVAAFGTTPGEGAGSVLMRVSESGALQYRNSASVWKSVYSICTCLKKNFVQVLIPGLH